MGGASGVYSWTGRSILRFLLTGVNSFTPTSSGCESSDLRGASGVLSSTEVLALGILLMGVNSLTQTSSDCDLISSESPSAIDLEEIRVWIRVLGGEGKANAWSSSSSAGSVAGCSLSGVTVSLFSPASSGLTPKASAIAWIRKDVQDVLDRPGGGSTMLQSIGPLATTTDINKEI